MAVVSGDVEQVVSDNTSFALELYSVLDKEEGNFVYSPYSISLVLAMAYAGAGGETERQMARSLSFTLPQDRLHPAFNALDLDLKSRGSGSQGRAFQLSIANSMWGQDGHSFLPTYLETLAVNYGGEIRPADFRQHPEEARRRINQWVSTETNGKVDGLLSHDAITPLTKLVLAQAVYFKAVWLHAFEPRATREWPFFALASTGRRVRMVELMRKTEWFGYARGDGFLAVDLPYSRSGVSMTILLPDAGRFIDFADSLNAEVIKEVLHGLMDRRIELEMPRFKLDASLDLVHILKAMGMPNAFDEKSAEFQGMDGLSRLAGDDEGLQISDVVHQAYVSVDEAGTEAAAATAVHMLVGHWSPERPVAVTIDRPFVFLIRDKRTGAILFLGQVVEL